MFVLALLAAACADPRGPVVVEDANSRLGGTILVRHGDSAWSIAQEAGVPLRDLIRANRLQPPYTLHPGQRLFIPNLRLHRVQDGESISVIAERYGVGRYKLARLNRIAPPYRVFPRQILKIPGTSEPDRIAAAPSNLPTGTAFESPPAPPDRTAPPAKRAEARPAQQQRPRATPAPAPAPAPTPQETARSGLIWPVGGRVISRFGPKQGGLHNDGVNIAAARGASVQAAGDGSVVYAGNEIQGFGNLVLIRHPGGITTAYAHLDQTLVKRGDRVRRGAPIATVGNSGGVRQPQLHFEIRRGRKAMDPLKALGPVPVATAS